MVTMVTRAVAEVLGPVPPDYVPPFGNFDATHYPWARAAAYYGLLTGIPLNQWFRAATRGECAQIVWNVMLRGD